jgi:phage tail sheath protein FI
MPQYLYPGVYVEELDTGNKPIEGVSTSTVGFLGIAERGPVTPTLITSFNQFTRNFGSYVKDNGTDRYLAYAVEGFFLNGGQTCYVQRVVSSTATPASDASGGMMITAIGPGTWGNRIAYRIDNAGLNDSTLFKLTVYYWSGTVPDISGDPPYTPAPVMTEVFDNLSAVTTTSTFYEAEINGFSNLITVKQTGAGRPTNAGTKLLGTQGADGGALVPADFSGEGADPTAKRGLDALGDVDDISILCCPDEFYLGPTSTTVSGYLVAQCTDLKYRFAILNSYQNAPQPPNHTPTQPSNYAAYYYPWLSIVNPVTGTPVLIPPCGHIAGIYARSDTNRGVQKDPANEQILGIDHLQLPINNALQGQLNPLGINCLRYFKAQGNLVWGGRTTSANPDWKYISVRRLFIFVEKSIQNGTQWVVFEPNDTPLWARVIRSVSDFLTGLWKDGMLQGKTKEQAFFVRCDRTTMTQADIDNGRLIMVIGIAPLKPAEFVIFRIGQWTGGSDVTES